MCVNCVCARAEREGRVKVIGPPSNTVSQTHHTHQHIPHEDDRDAAARPDAANAAVAALHVGSMRRILPQGGARARRHQCNFASVCV